MQYLVYSSWLQLLLTCVFGGKDSVTQSQGLEELITPLHKFE